MLAVELTQKQALHAVTCEALQDSGILAKDTSWTYDRIAPPL